MGILLLSIVLYLQYWRKPAVASPKRKGLATPIQLTDEQQEFIDDIIDIEIEDQIADLESLDALDDFEQELFAVFRAYLDPDTSITADQAMIIEEYVEVAIGEEIDYLQNKELLSDEEQEDLDAYLAYQNETSEPDMQVSKQQFKHWMYVVINYSIKKVIDFVRAKIGNRSVDDVDEHPLDQQAMEILRYLWIVDNEIEQAEEQIQVLDRKMDDQIVTNQPILQLLEWSATKMEHDQKIVQLFDLPPNEVTTLLAGKHGENSPAGDYFRMDTTSHEEIETIKAELRMSLNWMLEEAEV